MCFLLILQEHEAVKLRKEILLIEGDTPKELPISGDADGSELETANTKLKYQILHLNKVLANLIAIKVIVDIVEYFRGGSKADAACYRSTEVAQ